MSQVNFGSVALRRKVSASVIMGGAAAIKKMALDMVEGEDKDLFRVFGVAIGDKIGTTDKGEYVRLIGTFECTNLLTGEVKQATNLFLPNVATDLIVAGLRGKDINSVNFAFIVGITRDDKAATMYTYYAKPIATASQVDPLAALRAEVNTALPLQLEAPKPAEKGKGK